MSMLYLFGGFIPLLPGARHENACQGLLTGHFTRLSCGKCGLTMGAFRIRSGVRKWWVRIKRLEKAIPLSPLLYTVINAPID